jgi:hypothetical protein
MKGWKAVAGVVLVFLLGVAAGGIGVYRYHRKAFDRFARGGPEMVSEYFVRRMSRQLDLDPSQKERIEAVVRRTADEAREARQQFRPRMEEIFEKGRREIRAELRPEQQRRFDEIESERRNRRDRWRGGMRGPGPHD